MAIATRSPLFDTEVVHQRVADLADQLHHLRHRPPFILEDDEVVGAGCGRSKQVAHVRSGCRRRPWSARRRRRSPRSRNVCRGRRRPRTPPGRSSSWSPSGSVGQRTADLRQDRSEHGLAGSQLLLVGRVVGVGDLVAKVAKGGVEHLSQELGSGRSSSSMFMCVSVWLCGCWSRRRGSGPGRRTAVVVHRVGVVEK